MSSALRNIRLVVAYDGTDFSGWQRQPAAPTVQATLESALARILGEPATANASGRTDAGVHAANQVANFKTHSPIPCENLVRALNDLLPISVRVKNAAEVSGAFHARHLARAKTYRYRILTAPVASPFMARYAYHYPYPLEVEKMQEAARLLEGRHDFSAFAAADDAPGSEGKKASAVRTIFLSRLRRRSRLPILLYEVQGSGFLFHMVRNIVGTLLDVGRGKLPPRLVLDILESRDRRRAGPTAPPQGLCLWKVKYDETAR
jgi:tRNA pseudouridine38-40 synthase